MTDALPDDDPADPGLWLVASYEDGKLISRDLICCLSDLLPAPEEAAGSEVAELPPEGPLTCEACAREFLRFRD